MLSSLSEKAYGIIKKKIMNSNGEKYLSLRKMAEELDMSYTPVREAFQRLERDGLLELVPKVGYFITELNLNDIIKIMQVRECLENFVFEKVFDFLTEEHIQTLSNYLDKQVKNLEDDDIKQYYKNDALFHKVFFDIYDNDYLTNLIENVREKYLMGSTKTIIEMKKHGVVEAIEEHKELIESIKKGDKQETINKFADHIEKSKQRIKHGYHFFS